MQDDVKVYMDSYMTSNGYVSWSLGLFSKTTSWRPNTKPGDHDTPNTHNRWFILFYHVRDSAWIEIHCNSIWLRAWSHMTSHYTSGSATTLHDFGDVLKRSLDTFFWALTISWSRLLARVWSGPQSLMYYLPNSIWLILSPTHPPYSAG
jgi:hypothetical protein